MDIKTLIAVATGKIPHNYRSGLCPDELQPDSRDPDCPACKILIEAEGRLAEMEAERAQAEGYVTALRYIAWEAAGYMDCVHAVLIPLISGHVSGLKEAHTTWRRS